MPLLQATLGTSRSGERRLVVSNDVGEDVGRIEFPLDHVALTARRVGARSAAQLWAEAIDAAWRLAGGAALPENAYDNVRKLAACALGRLPSSASAPVSIEVVSSRYDGDWVLEASSSRFISPFEAEIYQLSPTIPGYSWRARHARRLAVGDRVHAFGDLDGDVIDMTSHRLGGGGVIRLRTADGRVIARRGREIQRAAQRDVIVAVDGEEHSLAATTEALSGPSGVALLALVHRDCPCEQVDRSD